MDDFDQFERNLAAALRSDADMSLGRFEAVSVAVAAMASAQRRSERIRRRFTIVPTSTRWAIAAAAVIGVIVVGGLYYVSSPSRPAIGGPTTTPTIRQNQSDLATPSAATTALLIWSRTSLGRDWPGPVRTEPDGGARILSMPETVLDANGNPQGQYTDPAGDTGSADFPWIDIQEVKDFAQWALVSNQPPVVDPTEQWIAYGLVIDDDRDGVPDWRYGIDNLPVDGTGRRNDWRVWRTDLHSGETCGEEGPPKCEFWFETWYPPGAFGDDVRFRGLQPAGAFYVWASVIQHGRVASTDYAPDVGWLDPSVKTTRVP